MAFSRPSLSEITERVQLDFVSRLDFVGSILRRSIIYVLARVVAGATHMLHGHLEYLSEQLFPDTSEDENLVRQAALFGIQPIEATFATATLTVTGTNGSVIPGDSETVLVRPDGTEYTVDDEVTISGGTGTITVTAALAGADSTLAVDDVLSFESPIAGVDSTTTVTASEDGSDAETMDALRVRLLARMSDPPHGGTLADYVEWSKEVAGVTRVWPVAQGLGPGTVVVRFVRDDDVSIIPDGGEVTTLQAYLDARKPAHATVTVVAPAAAPIDFDITLVPNTTATRAAVTAELTDMLFREGEPGGTTLLSSIHTAIGSAAGVTDYTLNSPSANVTHTANQLPTFGNPSYS